MSHFAVIDLETTGLSPAHHHRIVEVGVVIVNAQGQEVDAWSTLVNPQRDVGASDIHGLFASDLLYAPTFGEIAGHLVSLLQGHIPVAHNLAFDAGFLSAEFQRLGISVPLGPTRGICTMRLASRYLMAAGRTLDSCCHAISYEIGRVHSAMDDARAAGRLLSHYLNSDPDFLSNWREMIDSAIGDPWPTVQVRPFKPISRQDRHTAVPEHFLGRIASKANRAELFPEANSYLALLDQVLLDRCISLHEEAELVAAAELIGLSRGDAVRCHHIYLNSLAKAAKEDGVVTPDEFADLSRVAQLLGLNDAHVADALASAEADGSATCCIQTFKLSIGDSVVFTGDASGINRSELEYQAKCLGLKPTSSVSKKTKLVAAADPDSLSGKARKARDLGVPIVSYRHYLDMLGDLNT